MGGKFEDLFGDEGLSDEPEEGPSFDEDEEYEESDAGSDPASGEATPPAPPPATAPPAPAEAAPEESAVAPVTNWENPEVIEKKGDVEHSNYTLKEAWDAGTLTAGRNYRTKKGGFFTGIGWAHHELSEHQLARMNADPAYREAVFKKGPH